MKDRPDETTLIAYHYGELEGEERDKVEAWLQQHPEEQFRLAGWKETQAVLGALRDKEVIAPPIAAGSNHRSFWREGYVRMSLGIAASLLIVLIAAKLLGLNASYSSGEMRIGFGSPPAAGSTLSEDRVAELIEASLRRNNEAVEARWLEDRKNMEDNIRRNVLENSERIDQLVRNVSIGQQQQIREFVSQLHSDNLTRMQDYLQLSTESQKEYVETLLVDFSKYLQEQRKLDLQTVQTSLTNLEQNTNQFKKDTEQILTSLITTGRSEMSKSSQ
jgi:hypothetical protein